MNKNIIIGVVALVILGAGFYYFFGSSGASNRISTVDNFENKNATISVSDDKASSCDQFGLISGCIGDNVVAEHVKASFPGSGINPDDTIFARLQRDHAKTKEVAEEEVGIITEGKNLNPGLLEKHCSELIKKWQSVAQELNCTI